MKESDFIGTIAGEVRWGMNGGYCYFHPHELPFDWSCSDDVLRHMMVASVELARLDGMSTPQEKTNHLRDSTNEFKSHLADFPGFA